MNYSTSDLLLAVAENSAAMACLPDDVRKGIEDFKIDQEWVILARREREKKARKQQEERIEKERKETSYFVRESGERKFREIDGLHYVSEWERNL